VGVANRNLPLARADPSQKSFLFTLRNPRNLPARKFALKPEKKDRAIWCESSWCPHFYDIAVSNTCNGKTGGYTDGFGGAYANDTGLDGETFFTGSKRFTVFEITE
jgi:hypothetical protein